MSHSSLISSLLANPAAHQVNRKEKMNATLDKMCENISSNRAKLNNASVTNSTLSSEAYGYNKRTGRGTGD